MPPERTIEATEGTLSTNGSDDAGPAPVGGDRYVEIMQRLHRITVSAAVAIMAFTIASQWGQWRTIGIVVAANAVILSANTWITVVLLKRTGAATAEALRLVVNVGLGVATYHVMHWPLAVWFWLPFIGLTFDPINRRVALRTLVINCAAVDAVALWDGVPWTIPLAFTAFAFFCWEMSKARFSIIRDMLLDSDLQRRELEDARASIELAHHQLREEVATRQLIEADRQQARKLEAVGRLASGIAHEINTPVQFVSDNVGFLRDASAALLGLIAAHQAAHAAVLQGTCGAVEGASLAAAERAADLPYLVAAVPEAIQSSIEGLDRIATIVRSMKEFAHPGEQEAVAFDLNRAIRSALTITNGEYQHVADIDADLGDVPPIVGHGGELNQLVLNIVVNAAQAIGDVVRGTEKRGRITVRSRLAGGDVLVSIHDTGAGIPAGIQHRIFDPFFTTKEVGKGTGQGLSIASSIAQKHGWRLTFVSDGSHGTTFSVRLPVAEATKNSGAEA